MFGEKGLGDAFKGYTSSLVQITQYLGTAEKSLDRIVSKSKDAGKAIEKVTNKSGTKSGKQLELGSNNARFSNEAIHDRIYDSMMPWLDKINALQGQQARQQFRTSLAMGAIDAGTAIVGGIGQMMPSTAPVIQQATNYYNAAVMGGFTGKRSSLEQATFSGMRGGITSPGSPGQVAQSLAMMGVTPTGASNSYYQQTLGAVGNAAKYLNMDNIAAVQAITGFTSGTTSKNLMQRMGIFTSDPVTGKERSTGAIMQDIADRMTNGSKITVEGVNRSFRSGNVGINLRALGLSEDQQQLVKQYLIEKAKGNNMDLSNNKTMDALMKKAGIKNKNPQDAIQKINASNTKAMQTAEEAYISGMNAAADSIEALNNAINQLTPTIGGLKSYFDTLQGSNAGKGAMDMGGKLLDTAGNIATTYMMMRMLGGGKGAGLLGKMFKGGGAAATAAASGASTAAKGVGFFGRMKGSVAAKGGVVNGAKSFLKSGWGKAGSVLAIAGGAITAAEGIGTSHQGASIGEGAGQATGAIIGGALGSLIPIPVLGTLVGSAVGGWLGGMAGKGIGGMWDPGGAFNGGTGGDLGTKGKSGKSSAGMTMKGHDPTETRQLSVGGGYSAGKHDGIDFAVDHKKVFAIFDGTVVDSGSTDVWGQYIIIDHGKIGGVNLKSRYQHLSSKLKTSGKVMRGGQIAVSGRSGKVTGPHLHLAIYENGKLVNPLKYVNATGGAGNYANTGTIVPSAESYSGNQTGTSGVSNQNTNTGTSTSLASSDNVMSLSPISFRQSPEYSDILGASNEAVTASSSKLGSRLGGVSLLSAIKQAGFRGDNLRLARAVAMASSGGNSKKHERKAGHDRYGLFQIDFQSSDGNQLRKAYMLKNVTDAYSPVLNAKMAYDLSKHGTEWSWNPKYVDNSYKKYLTGGTSASAGINYVSHDQPVNVHAGEAILDANQAREYRQNKMIAENSKKTNVVVNVTVAQASEAEARRLANLVKKYLEDEALIDNVRSM